MRKENTYKFLYAVALLMLMGFCVRLGADYYKYNDTINSAPFYAFVIERAIEFIIPCILCFVIARITKKKYIA